MDAESRRNQIIDRLNRSEKPLSASALAREFQVSRQIIVGDVALLRASGTNIDATPRGYILNRRESTGIVRQIACRHQSEHMQEELYAIVDQGCTISDVIVEHPLYGQLTGSLRLSSRYDVDRFIEKSKESDALPLSFLTEGIHLHTIICPNEDAYQRVLQSLESLGFLLSSKM